MQALFLVFAALLSFSYAADEVKDLPGLTQSINFKQYAGYKTVDAAHGRKLFYWFVESQSNPSTDPVVLWLNGGPGCSSLGGMFTELGPFRPNEDGKTLSLNPWSWNKVANVIFLESPAGVGFSYSQNTSDYTTGDVRTAEDAFIFLGKFYEDFPQFKSNKFWITGESYGGHYVPELAHRVIQGNSQGESAIPLEGIMVGNAWTWMPIDNEGAVFYWWSHALISDFTYKNIFRTCNFSHIGPLEMGMESSMGSLVGSPLDECDNFVNDAMTEMGNVNIYDIYVDMCTQKSHVLSQLSQSGSKFHEKILKHVSHAPGEPINPPYQPCSENYLASYLNLAPVQAAIHAEPTNWQMCSSIVHYNYSDVERSVMPLYDYFRQHSLRVLVYSGDVDAIVPVTGTRAWIKLLNRRILQKWRPWTINQQVGGYIEEYDGLTFSTVREAGHMVPQTQPERAFYMFSHFLKNQPF